MIVTVITEQGPKGTVAITADETMVQVYPSGTISSKDGIDPQGTGSPKKASAERKLLRDLQNIMNVDAVHIHPPYKIMLHTNGEDAIMIADQAEVIILSHLETYSGL